MTELNPIERRLVRLREQWRVFAEDPNARLLRWLVSPIDSRMLDAFFAVEASEHAVTDDLFLRLEEPFRPGGYGARLVDALGNHYEVLRATLREAGIDASWKPPPPSFDDVAHFLAALASFERHHRPMARHVTVVFQAIAAPDVAWIQWVTRLIERADAPEVRFIALEHLDSPALVELAKRQTARVRTVAADVDTMGALFEISKAAGGLDKPHGVFREAYLKICDAMGKRDMPEAERIGQEILALTWEQDWLHLGVAVHFALGTGYVNEQNIEPAVAHYGHAEKIALAAHERGEPYGRDLQVKSRMALGSVYIVAEEFIRAAEIYEETVPLAEELADPIVRLECWRMAAYCREGAGEPRLAWDRGHRALEVGRMLDDEARRASTLGFVGEALVRLAQQAGARVELRELEKTMEALLGPDWRPSASR